VYGYSTQPAVQNGPPFGGVRIARMNETLVCDGRQGGDDDIETFAPFAFDRRNRLRIAH
jgi:hypothetical protein